MDLAASVPLACGHLYTYRRNGQGSMLANSLKNAIIIRNMPNIKTLFRGLLLSPLAALVVFYAATSSSGTSFTAQIIGPGSTSSSASTFSSAAAVSGGTSSTIAPMDEGNPDSFARCKGYERLFPANAPVPEGRTLIEVWGATFEREMDRMTEEYFANERNGDTCPEQSKETTSRLVRVVQQFECALIDASNSGFSTAARVVAEQNENDEDEADFFEIFQYMDREKVQLEHARSVSRIALDYILKSPVFRCDNVAILEGRSAAPEPRPEDEFPAIFF